MITLCVELLEVAVMSIGGCSITLASSQLKFSSCLYAVTILLYLKKNESKIQYNTCICKVGDCSFGIYFLHCMVLWIIQKMLSVLGISQHWFESWILTFLITTVVSYMIVMMVRTVVGDTKKLRWIGFD